MLTFSQQDGRWSDFKFGGNYTIGRYGCVIVCITMVDDWFFNATRDPIWIASMLDFSNGLLIWDSLKRIELKLIARIYGRNDSMISEALVNPFKCVILQVNNSHWVFAIGRKVPVLGYRIVDPWDGKVKYTNSYSNNITGFAVICKD